MNTPTHLLLPLVAVLCAGELAAQSVSPQHAVELADFLEGEGPSAASFVESHMASDVVERVGAETLVSNLERLRADLEGTFADELFPAGEARFAVSFVGRGPDVSVLVQLAEAAPHEIVDAWIEGRPGLDPDAKHEPLPPPLTWDGLEARLAAEVAAGLTGALVVVRDDEVVLDEGFGMANRELGHPVTPDTIFAIGSTPIDFTKVGILMLWRDEVLSLDEPLSAFFDDVPADKRGITVQHLMTGRSGLRDFHDLPSDRDPDHSWIDRDEAVRRILSFDLLFEPGMGAEHSHSAWGLLAAIVEIRSGLSYPEFTRELLFEPAGMHDTGFFGEEIPLERLAIGYGSRTDGEINAPPYWGPTSWLVMGSGGMVSTTGDMLRWNRALRSGLLLDDEMQRRYWGPPGDLLSGGDMYGFEIFYDEGPGSLFILISNAVDRTNRLRFNRFARDLHALMMG